MITREQYLEALDIVETYHQQLRQFSVGCSLDWDNLKAGDFILFDKTMSKNVTVGKKYKVTDVGHDWKKWSHSWFTFLDDNNKRKSLRKYAQGYSMRMV